MQVEFAIHVNSLVTAIGIGLLIGVVRERLHAGDDGAVLTAGVRTHALVAILSAVAASFGPAVLAVVLVAVAALGIASYWRTAGHDPGLTGEVALMVTALLAALAQRDAVLATGLGVVVAVLLFAKLPLHHFAREVISPQELRDGLLLAAAALVVLPLLSREPVDPWGVLVPAMLWQLVVLVMAVGMLGHVALRTVGARWGFPIAGFFAGFASSTAAVAGFGRRARESPSQLHPAVGAALLANLASLILLSSVVGAAAPQLLVAAAWPLGSAGAILLAGGLAGMRAARGAALPAEPPARAFHTVHAVSLAALIAALLLVSAWLKEMFGTAGVMAATISVAMANLQAAGAGLAQLQATGELDVDLARRGLVALLGAAASAKTVIAAFTGGYRYAVRVGVGLGGMVAAAVLGLWLTGT